MIDCLILGDSIAVGVAQNSPQCHSAARSGIRATEFNRRFDTGEYIYENVLISLGSNDGRDEVEIRNELQKLRGRITADQVVWLLPNNNATAFRVVQQIARENRDRVLSIRQHVSDDNVHPTPQGYRRISQIWRNRS